MYQIRCQSVQPFDSFPRLLNLWPPTPQMPPSVLRGDLDLAYVLPWWIRRREPKLVPIGPAVWQLPQTFECVTPYPPPPNAPWCIEGRHVFSLCPFPDESADVNQSWCQSDSFPVLLNCWPPKTHQVPPLCHEGQFVWRISIPMWICTCVLNLVPIGPAVW